MEGTILLLLRNTDTFAEQVSSNGSAFSGKVSVLPAFQACRAFRPRALLSIAQKPSPRPNGGRYSESGGSA